MSSLSSMRSEDINTLLSSVFCDTSKFKCENYIGTENFNGKEFPRMLWEDVEKELPNRCIFYVNPIITDNGQYTVLVIAECEDNYKDMIMYNLLLHGYPVTFRKTNSIFVGGVR